MKKHIGSASVTLVIALLLTSLAAGVAGCGSTDGTTTTAALQTTTTAPATTAAVTAGTEAVTTSTEAATTSTEAAQAGPLGAQSKAGGTKPQDYPTQMLAFGKALAALPVTDDPSNFTDVAAITAGQLKAAKQYVAGIHKAVDQLKAVKPPAGIADAHAKVVAQMDALAAATDKLMTAALTKDQAGFDAAQAEGQAAVQALQTAMEELRTAMGGATPKN